MAQQKNKSYDICIGNVTVATVDLGDMSDVEVEAIKNKLRTAMDLYRDKHYMSAGYVLFNAFNLIREVRIRK